MTGGGGLASRPAPPRPVLVALRALGLGDLLTAVPALRALRRAHPDHHLAVATSAASAPLVPAVGCADEVVVVEELGALPAHLHHADVAVNLHGRGPQSHAVLAAAHPKRLMAFACGDVAGPGWDDDEHEVDRWCRMLGWHGIDADRTDLGLDLEALPEPPPWSHDAVVVHPGAKCGARRWPPDRWAAVARALARRGHRVVVTGGGAERELAEGVARMAGLGQGAVVAGATPLPELAAAVAAARLVLVGDTGVAHLATAVATPSVVLMGPMPPALWGPPRERPAHRALWAGIRSDPLAEEVAPGLLAITVGEVLTATDEVLAVGAASR